MKAIILAGGFGTRISEESVLKPKPMIEIGHKPILWHIMKIYSHHGVNDFIVCCGYKSYVIKEYFANYSLYTSDITFDLNKNIMHVHKKYTEPWKVTLVDTGLNTMTGGRLKRVQEYVKNEKNFCLTYGDGVGDIDITNLIKAHINSNKIVTLTATKPTGRFGIVDINDRNEVMKFQEKPEGNNSWINAGFFVLTNDVFDYIKNDQTIWEKEPLDLLAFDKKLGVWKHDKFWHPMDNLRDKLFLEKLWQEKKAPWKIWKD